MGEGIEIYQCPNCSRQVVGNVTKCKFCGATVAPTPPLQLKEYSRAELARYETPGWIWTIYRAAAIAWALSNGAIIALDLSGNVGLLSALDLVARFAFAAMALALLQNSKRDRSWGNAAAGACVALTGVQLAAALWLHWGPIWIAALSLNLGLAAATQWLISETAQNLWE